MHRKNIDAAFNRTWDYLKYNEACMCLKHNILNRVKWLFEDFAYYAREDDEEVPIGCIGAPYVIFFCKTATALPLSTTVRVT